MSGSYREFGIDGEIQMATAAYPILGIMQMPAGFKYREVFRRGRPKHEKYDPFWIKHPPMPARRWAKIFAPFDALDGFDERIAGKEVLYCERRSLSDGEMEELNHKLSFLHSLTYNGREARKNTPAVTITYFDSCTDIESDWYNHGGQYKELSGTVLRVDLSSIRIKTANEEVSVPFDDIWEIGQIHRKE